MMSSAERRCWLDTREGRTILRLAGAWRLADVAKLGAELDALPAANEPLAVDGTRVSELDTAGALALLLHLRARGAPADAAAFASFSPTHQRVLELVRGRLGEIVQPTKEARFGLLASIGAKTMAIAGLLRGDLNFLGRTAVEAWRLVLRPRSLRLKETTAQFEQVCLNAIPVASLVTFLIGVVFAYLLGMQAEKYGANIFVVDGVGVGMTRELAPIIIAVIIAGRSGAAFTAQLGTMRLTEEIDAIRTLGLSPMQVLVMPRLLGLMVALPLLTFVGDCMSIIGAMSVAGPMLGITPTTFIDRLHTALPLRHLVVGLAKAPVFAIFIAVIGCHMGMTVSRDTRSIGVNTTSTVVQSIVSVILLDAMFAVFLQELSL